VRVYSSRTKSLMMTRYCVCVAVPVQLVDMCQLDLAGNWTTSDPDHSSTVLSKEAKVLGKETDFHCVGLVILN